MPTLEAEDIDALTGKVRYRLGRALYLTNADFEAGTVAVGNSVPRDITNYDADDPEPTMKFYNVHIMDAPLRRTEEGVAVDLPDRDGLHDRYTEAFEARDDIPEPAERGRE